MANVRGNVGKVRAVFALCEKSAQKILEAATEKEAKAALIAWRNMFNASGKRRTLKRAKPKENPYFVWDVRKGGGLRQISSVRDFKKAVKRDRRKGTGFQGRDVGKISRLRERRFDAKVDALKNKRLLEDPEFAASGEGLESDLARKKKKKMKSVAWLDAALQDGFDGFVKESASAPGDFPITWKYPSGAGRRSMQDYYLRSAMALKKIDATRWELVIKPFFTTGYGKDVLRTLELGGRLRKTRRPVLVGYTVVYYRLNTNGQSAKKRRAIETRGGVATGTFYGGERRKIVPRYRRPTETVSIAARPFLKALKERVDADKLKYFKR